SPRRFEMIAEELSKRGYKDAYIQKIIGGNFETALSRIWRD
ncbi:MAG: membrane dipeptidase, partial [Acidobacteriaceae bacterium]|nr:membrane dipeptidase [Acidobacteriaceae bacterium]